MKKTVLFIILFFTVIVVLGIVFYVQAKKVQSPPVAVQKNQETVKIQPTPKERKTWDDPAGFTYTYDAELAINKHDEDQVNYAHIEMTYPEYPGTILLWAKDTTAADLKSWIRTEKSFQGASVIDTTLGGQPAKKIVITEPQRKLIIGSLYDGLLFIAELTGENNVFWQTEFDTIVESFTFKPLQNNMSDQGSTGQAESEPDVSADEEEVIQ